MQNEKTERTVKLENALANVVSTLNEISTTLIKSIADKTKLIEDTHKALVVDTNELTDIANLTEDFIENLTEVVDTMDTAISNSEDNLAVLDNLLPAFVVTEEDEEDKEEEDNEQ